MVVANARESQRRLARAGAKADGTGTIGDTHQIFEQFADIAIGETKVAMSCLALDREQSGIDEVGKMPADRLFGNARNVGELGCRQSLAADQRGKHVCAGMISDQRRDAHDVRAVFHGSMLAGIMYFTKATEWAMIRHRQGKTLWSPTCSIRFSTTKKKPASI